MNKLITLNKSIEFKIQYFWIGAYWKINKPDKNNPVCHCGDTLKQHSYYTGHTFCEMGEPRYIDLYICIIPCFPIHISTYF